ncbi:triose-phosphate isomerase [Bacteriovoracales bacterium]|nr:triose-phosphate isomerase [Bacteriovoracales bacterium]
MRVPLIAGNWKMNMTIPEAVELVNGIKIGLRWPEDVDVVVAPPFTSLKMVSEVAKDSYIAVSAQNVHHEENGAYTGEIAASFIKDAGANYVIIGHSERRQHCNETDELVNKKVRIALKNELKPIVCVGETLEQREQGNFVEVIEKQLSVGLEDLTQVLASELVIAYEPVWAIGTGKVATVTQIEEVHEKIRAFLAKNFSEDVANSVRVLYGGSVKAENSKEILSLPNVDGALVGGASLNSAGFIEIIKSLPPR